MPGVLMIEALAQTAGILAFLTHSQHPEDDAVVYLAGTDRCRFKRPVTPGDQLILEAKFLVDKRRLMKFACRALVDDQVVCETELMRPAPSPSVPPPAPTLWLFEWGDARRVDRRRR